MSVNIGNANVHILSLRSLREGDERVGENAIQLRHVVVRVVRGHDQVLGEGEQPGLLFGTIVHFRIVEVVGRVLDADSCKLRRVPRIVIHLISVGAAGTMIALLVVVIALTVVIVVLRILRFNLYVKVCQCYRAEE